MLILIAYTLLYHGFFLTDGSAVVFFFIIVNHFAILLVIIIIIIIICITAKVNRAVQAFKKAFSEKNVLSLYMN